VIFAATARRDLRRIPRRIDRQGVRASPDSYAGGGTSTTADRQIGYRMRAFPHTVIDLDEIRRSRQRSPL